jgi:DNA-binding NarL/FixJ family response regulator
VAGDAIRVVIADDQTLFAEGLKTILESRASDIKVLAIASNGREAVECVGRHVPEIVLLDVRMPDMDGVDAAREIHRRFPSVKIVMLTTFDDDEYVKSSLMFGAVGYLLKNRPPAEIIASIRAVQGGILQIDPAVSKTLICQLTEKTAREDPFVRSLYSLTTRERDVLRLLAEPCDNHEIARRIGVAEQTVRNYVSTIYAKLGMLNRVEIMRHMDMIQLYLDRFIDRERGEDLAE